ncbi:hypothetical protein DY000_02015467 [Brassica cretica]|uniref:Uncharacterized protein n=1 Tax=Brassica cretica TaxID=69181 RepID=A0ABQ7CMW6_BRACR|nr:hypothetical protein DY000_02015467 [Brassica cretica]
MQQMQQQMQQMQQTIAAQQLAAQQAAQHEPLALIDTKKIDDLAAKVDQLLKNNQRQIYVMEEATMEPGAIDATEETETSEENQQEVSCGKRNSHRRDLLIGGKPS